MQNQPGGPPPVFVDGTGRRRRLTVIVGSVMGLGLLTSLGLIVAGLFLDTSVSLPGWSDNRTPPPLEAGVNGRDGLGGDAPPAPAPSSVTSSAPVPTLSRTPGARPTTAPSGATDHPGQGDERRDSTGKPSKSPGKPR
ncbi:hypothetical protein ACVCAH_04845 [Micromonospora sp. LZ34]